MINKVGLALVAVLWAAVAAAQPLTILFFNDFHSRMEPFTLPGGGGEVGGLARLAGLADEIRDANEAAGVPTFLLVAGDVLQGSPYSTIFKGEVEFECLNRMDVTAFTLGNHEFDYGQANLRDLVARAKFPVVAANVLPAAGEGVPALGAAETAWLHVGDKRILVLGLTTPETPYTTAPLNTTGLVFKEPAAVASRLVDLHKSEAAGVIALTHLGFERDVELARAVPALDVIVGGHSHTKLERPEVVGKTVIGQAYEYGEFLGRMDCELGDEGLSVKSYELLPVTPVTEEDAEVAAVLAVYRKMLSEELNEVVARVDVLLSYKALRGAETNFGDVVADAMREATGADVALMNAGGIRADLGPGDVTAAAVLTALPFGNEIVVLEVPGRILREAFDLCGREKIGTGGFLQVSGCGYTVREGEGVVSVTVAGKPLAEGVTYKVAMPDFLASGGDGYTMFVGKLKMWKTGLRLDDVVVSALQTRKDVPGAPAGRIKVIKP